MEVRGPAMKAILVFIVVVIVAVLAFNYFTTGELKLLPGSSKSPEEQELDRLAENFRAAVQEFEQAGRQAALSGMDSTYAAGAAMAAANGVERDLKALRSRVDDPAVVKRVDELLSRVKKFQDEVR
jgi:hypothetical protein